MHRSPKDRTPVNRRLLPPAVALCFLTVLTAGTVAEQRARLPPPADCSDPVTGVWKSHDFFERRMQWYETWLYIDRVEGSDTQLTGHMEVQMWAGGRDLEQPPSCDETSVRYRVRQPAQGRIDDTMHVDFDATSWEVEAVICGEMRSYNPDRFSGTIVPELNEFQSLNNDGGMAVNFPSVFRRIRCSNEPEAPADPPRKPPPFQPPSSGCAWW